jgi:GT2 family glycosyltransferase
MGQPQVSVVIPVWNGERYLKEAIESILAQDFGDFELIIVDDGSTDESVKIADSFVDDPRVSIRRQANAGVVAARNAGLLNARAEFVAFLDADDVAIPSRLSKQFTYLQGHPEVAAVGSHISHFNADKGAYLTQVFPIGVSRVADALEDGNPLAQPAVMLRKSMVAAVGGYREAFKFGAEDYDLWLRLSERHLLDNLPEVLTLYRIHPDSLTHRRRHEQTFAALAAACAHRRRITGRGDPLEGLSKPLSPAVLPLLGLSEIEESAFMPSLFGLLAKSENAPDLHLSLVRRAWELRAHIPRGRLVRHCLAPAISVLRKAGRTGQAIGWFARAFVTEPVSACWMLLR